MALNSLAQKLLVRTFAMKEDIVQTRSQTFKIQILK